MLIFDGHSSHSARNPTGDNPTLTGTSDSHRWHPNETERQAKKESVGQCPGLGHGFPGQASPEKADCFGCATQETGSKNESLLEREKEGREDGLNPSTRCEGQPRINGLPCAKSGPPRGACHMLESLEGLALWSGCKSPASGFQHLHGCCSVPTMNHAKPSIKRYTLTPSHKK